ncbi:MAG: sugar ABC transporter substrate-binding protein [Selenomonadaceae bacterium]|nr:sugar ABC transporter substrate-binding protein [Selenomonadaceae bacterium]
MNHSKIFNLLIVLMLTLLISGCGGGRSGVAYMSNDDDDFFCSLIRGEFRRLAEEKNLKVEYYDAKEDINIQIDQMKDAISHGVKTIILIAVDDNLIMPSVNLANRESINVIVLNRNIKAGQYHKVLSDEYEAGKLQADYMINTLPQNAKIVYLEGTSNQQSSIKRLEGFRNECLNKRTDIELLDIQDGNYSKSEAMKITSLWLSIFPKIDAVICGNDQMALGAITALKLANRLEGCQVVGVDAVDEALKAIEKGEMVQTIKQDAIAQANGALELALAAENNQELRDIIIPFVSITKDNLTQYLRR